MRPHAVSALVGQGITTRDDEVNKQTNKYTAHKTCVTQHAMCVGDALTTLVVRTVSPAAAATPASAADLAAASNLQGAKGSTLLRSRHSRGTAGTRMDRSGVR
eukprot:8128361-Pyramimonas_sp.AAC.1